MTQLYRKVKDQDRYEDGSWARSYAERFEPVELPTREELESVITKQFRKADMPWMSESPWYFADAILELIERKMAA